MITNEQRTIARAQKGDIKAFESLMDAHASYVYNLALRTLRNADDAEDAAQEAMIRAWNGLPKFRLEASFKTWLYRIVTNLCYNRLPRMRRDLLAMEVDASLPLADSKPSVEQRALGRELEFKLHEAIAELPDHYRMLITMRHLQEMSYAEIAAATNMPLGTVKTGIHRGRHRLQQILRVHLAEQDVLDRARRENERSLAVPGAAYEPQGV